MKRTVLLLSSVALAVSVLGYGMLVRIGVAALIAFGVPVVKGRGIEGRGIVHGLFDANHCLQRIEVSAGRDNVDFYWGCGSKTYLTMECVYDTVGYRDWGAKFAGAGWHCNRPLPVLKLDGVNRIADVAVRAAGEKAAWAACFVEGYGDSNSREKPYHRSECYRALGNIQRVVNETQRPPENVAEEVLR